MNHARLLDFAERLRDEVVRLRMDREIFLADRANLEPDEFFDWTKVQLQAVKDLANAAVAALSSATLALGNDRQTASDPLHVDEVAGIYLQCLRWVDYVRSVRCAGVYAECLCALAEYGSAVIDTIDGVPSEFQSFVTNAESLPEGEQAVLQFVIKPISPRWDEAFAKLDRKTDEG